MTRPELEQLRGLLAEATIALLRRRHAQADEAIADAHRRVQCEIEKRCASAARARRSS